jgi:hypothetical protein
LQLDLRSTAGVSFDLAIDSTGLHVRRRRDAGCEGWQKLPIAVDPDSGNLLAEELTLSEVHDSVPVPAMLGRIEGQLGRVFGDGAHAGGPTYRAVAEHRQALPNAEGVIRPTASDVKAATLDPLSGRGRHARHVARHGRAVWEPAAGYGRRNAAAWIFSRLKRGLGTGLRSRRLDAQRAEAGIAARVLNRMAALGMRRAQRVARSVSLARRQCELMRRDAPEPRSSTTASATVPESASRPASSRAWSTRSCQSASRSGNRCAGRSAAPTWRCRPGRAC